MSAKIVKQALTTLFNDKQCDPTTVSQFFSKDYLQYFDDKIIDYQDLINNLESRVAKFEWIKINFKELIEQNDKVASLHIFEGMTKDAQEIHVQCIAIFYIKEGKLAKCIEVSRQIKDIKTDKFYNALL